MIKGLGPPSWFISFTCNDSNWPDLLEASCGTDRQENVNTGELMFERKVHLVEQYPITVARQFMVRVNTLLCFMKSNDHVLVVKWLTGG